MSTEIPRGRSRVMPRALPYPLDTCLPWFGSMVGPQALQWAIKGMGGVASQAPGRCCGLLVLPCMDANRLGRQPAALWWSLDFFGALGWGLELAEHAWLAQPGTRIMAVAWALATLASWTMPTSTAKHPCGVFCTPRRLHAPLISLLGCGWPMVHSLWQWKQHDCYGWWCRYL